MGGKGEDGRSGEGQGTKASAKAEELRGCRTEPMTVIRRSHGASSGRKHHRHTLTAICSRQGGYLHAVWPTMTPGFPSHFVACLLTNGVLAGADAIGLLEVLLRDAAPRNVGLNGNDTDVGRAGMMMNGRGRGGGGKGRGCRSGRGASGLGSPGPASRHGSNLADGRRHLGEVVMKRYIERKLQLNRELKLTVASQRNEQANSALQTSIPEGRSTGRTQHKSKLAKNHALIALWQKPSIQGKSPQLHLIFRSKMPRCARILAPIALALGVAADVQLLGLAHAPGSSTDCYLFSLDATSGLNQTLQETTACSQVSTTWPSFSALNREAGTMEVLIATAPSLFSFDLSSGAQKTVASLPSYNQNDPFLGLARTGGYSYIITTSTVSAVVNGKTQVLLSGQAFPQEGVVAAAEPGTGPAGSNFGSRIFIADGSDASGAVVVLTFDQDDPLGKPSVSTITTGVARPWNLSFRNGTNTLVLLASYKLYSADATAPNGQNTLLMDIPDGPGYPRTYTISPSGNTYVFLDFSFVYTIPLNSTTLPLNVATKQPYTGSPRSVGFPVWRGQY